MMRSIDTYSIRIILLALALLFCFSMLVDSNYNKNLPFKERQALHDLYVSTNGDDWVYQDGDEGHWNFTDPDVNPCSSSDPWQGLNCTVISTNTSTHYYYISEILLSNYNLRGTIPHSIGTLRNYII